MNEKLYQVALHQTHGIGDANTKILIAYCGSASEVFKTNRGALKKIPGIGEKIIDAINPEKGLKKAEEILKKCETHKISIHHFTDRTYPRRLKQIADAPSILFSRGSIPDYNKVIAIVGTRNATEYGKSVTEKIVSSCKVFEPVIVSGMAYGIDIAAHKSAIESEITTMGVLAGGLDKIYPSVHKKYADEMVDMGGSLLSENPPGTKPDAHFFPARNRIIAGMSDVIIVVEAAKKGGALITANIADSYNKPVFAIPGELDSKYSEGCNYLIRNQKALIYTGINDLEYHLNWDQNKDQVDEALDLTAFEPEEQLVLQILIDNPKGIGIDDISWKAQIGGNALAGLLLNLEFQGHVKALPGKKYKISRST